MEDLMQEPSPPTSAPRVVGWLALAGVSVIAGIASYFHALAVVQSAGASGAVAYLVPALADLVILGASADLLAASRAGHSRPPLTMVALSVGIVVTLAMNVAAGWPHGWGSRLVAGWPALAFILALESLSGLVRRGRSGAGHAPAPATSSQDQAPEPLGTKEALQALLESGSQRKLADALGVPKSRVEAWSAMTRKAPGTPAGGAQEGRPPSEHSRLGAQPAAASARRGQGTASGVPALAATGQPPHPAPAPAGGTGAPRGLATNGQARP